MSRLPPITTVAHWYLRQLLPKNAKVVDATCGNGHDAAVLAELILPEGYLLAVDIQAEAVQATTARLVETDVPRDRWSCILADHCDLTPILPPPLKTGIDAAVFNLGYLPSGKKDVTTSHSSLLAMGHIRPLLRPAGLLVLTTYPGFPEGLTEHNMISDWLIQQAKAGHELHHLAAEGRRSRPPELWILRTQQIPSTPPLR